MKKISVKNLIAWVLTMAMIFSGTGTAHIQVLAYNNCTMNIAMSVG